MEKEKNYNFNIKEDFNEIDEKYLDEIDSAELSFDISTVKPLPSKDGFETKLNEDFDKSVNTLKESKEVKLGDLKPGDIFIDTAYDNQRCKVLGSLADDDRIDFEVLDGEDKGLRFSKGKAATVLVETLKEDVEEDKKNFKNLVQNIESERIKDELKARQDYINDAKAIEDAGKDLPCDCAKKIAAISKDLAKEENVHVGELEKIMNKVTDDEFLKNTEEGHKEAGEKLESGEEVIPPTK